MAQVVHRYAQNAHGAYKAQEIATARAEKLILVLYDYAIKACHLRNQEQASRALAQLIDSLNFEHQEVATGLFKLYVYLIETVKKEQFEVALRILKELRETWNSVVKDIRIKDKGIKDKG